MVFGTHICRYVFYSHNRLYTFIKLERATDTEFLLTEVILKLTGIERQPAQSTDRWRNWLLPYQLGYAALFNCVEIKIQYKLERKTLKARS